MQRSRRMEWLPTRWMRSWLTENITTVTLCEDAQNGVVFGVPYPSQKRSEDYRLDLAGLGIVFCSHRICDNGFAVP